MGKMDFGKQARNLVDRIRAYGNILIYIQGSPDPDGLASAFLFKLICEGLERQAAIVSANPPSLPQNIRLIRDLQLPVQFHLPPGQVKKYDAYVILDFQSVSAEGITGVIPCLAHIDHHEKTKEELPVDFSLVLEDAGSTSGILVRLFREMGIEVGKKSWRRAATALYYGIQTDTDNFSHATALDRESLSYLEPRVDKRCLSRIASLPISGEAVDFLRMAARHQVVIQRWLIAGVGFIEEDHRDNLALVADLLLKRAGIETVVVFGLIRRPGGLTLDASLRTRDRELDLNRLIKDLVRNGGARHYKGAFQVNLDFFVHAPDPDRLWEMVRDTTINALRGKIREVTPSRFGHLIQGLWKRVTGLFSRRGS